MYFELITAKTKKKENTYNTFLKHAGPLQLSEEERTALKMVLNESLLHGGSSARIHAQNVIDRVRTRLKVWEKIIKTLESKLEYMGEMP